MKGWTRTSEKSIRSRIWHIVIVTAMIMAIGFYISFALKDRMTTEYDKSMGTNIMLSNLSIELNKSIDSLDSYIKTRDIDYMNEYVAAKDKIDKILQNIQYDIQQDHKSGVFLRNFKNMFGYHTQLVNEILIKDRLDFDTYNKLLELKMLFVYMNNHAQMMTTTYLNYSSNQYSNLLENYREIEKNIYLVFIFFGIMSFIFAVVLSNDILKTIDRLSKSAELLSNAHWEVEDLRENSYIELNTLAKAFNNMKKNIISFIEELNKQAELEINLNKQKLENIEKDKLLKESQLRSLQMQMDPHFLFNTLNTVGRTAMFEGADTTVSLIEAVSKILRYNLRHMGKMVELKEEINVLKAYTVIQQTRFQDQMVFEFEMYGNLEGVMIPPMTIQPIVENAIIHGLQNKERDGKIHIFVQQDKEYVEILVEDNGAGIEKHLIDKIFDEKDPEKKKGHTTGLGLANVKKRLELQFGETNLITIEGHIGEGTTVKVRIPLKESNRDD